MQLLGHQSPLASALGLATRGAPHRLYGDLADPIFSDRVLVENWLFVSVITPRWVIERHHGLAMPLAQLAAGVLDRAVIEDLRQGVVVDRVLRQVCVDGDLAAVPEGQAMEDGCQVLDHCPSLGLLLQV